MIIKLDLRNLEALPFAIRSCQSLAHILSKTLDFLNFLGIGRVSVILIVLTLLPLGSKDSITDLC